jgi:L-ribulose-5-phosphate 3-epimerase
MAALGPHGYCAAPKRNLRKAIMYSTIGVKGSVLGKFRAMKEAGFEGVEPMGGMKREEVMAAFKETGLQAASVCCHTHWEKPLSAPDEATRKVGLDGLVTSLHDAKAYGAGSVLLVPGVARNGVTYRECFDRWRARIFGPSPRFWRTGTWRSTGR